MTKRVKFTDKGLTTAAGHAIYEVTFDGQPFGHVEPRWNRLTGVTGWVAFPPGNYVNTVVSGEGPNRGRAVAALLVKTYEMPWREALDAAGVK